MFPLTPAGALFSVTIETEPLVVSELTPLLRTILPPLKVEPMPAVNKTSPPAPPCPPVTFTDPPAEPVESWVRPAVIVAAPPTPEKLLPTLNTMAPPDEVVPSPLLSCSAPPLAPLPLLKPNWPPRLAALCV